MGIRWVGREWGAVRQRPLSLSADYSCVAVCAYFRPSHPIKHRKTMRDHENTTAAPWRRVRGRRPAVRGGNPRGSAGAARRCRRAGRCRRRSCPTWPTARPPTWRRRGAAPRGRRPSSAAWPRRPTTTAPHRSAASRRGWWRDHRRLVRSSKGDERQHGSPGLRHSTGCARRFDELIPRALEL